MPSKAAAWVVPRREPLGDRRAQRHAVLDHAVGQPQELDHVDADDACRLQLLGLAHDAALFGIEGVDPGLAARDQPYTLVLPWSVQGAIAAAAPNPTTSARSQSSSNGCRGPGSMPPA